MYLQEKDNVYDLKWNSRIAYGEIHHQDEVEFSIYNFDQADVEQLRTLFRSYEQESKRLNDVEIAPTGL